jgi:hypothetical protein
LSPIETHAAETDHPRGVSWTGSLWQPGTDALWVFELTHVPNCRGFVYAAFVIEWFARGIVG